ncbi:MAG TPA: hypothetical protein VMK12_08655 [Anaeromyxobacteraceae bacterium]|nr:hypothetical protein [Anaeromyxobacteraceae bacterium]
MGKTNTRLEAARKVYREALESARARPTGETWAKLLAAGKELSLAQESRGRSSKRSARASLPSLQDLEGEATSQESAELD